MHSKLKINLKQEEMIQTCWKIKLMQVQNKQKRMSGLVLTLIETLKI
jgi:hypothetical protein